MTHLNATRFGLGIVGLMALCLAGCTGGGEDDVLRDRGGKQDDLVDNCGQPRVVLEQSMGGLEFNRPVAAVFHPTEAGAWYVVEQRGVVWRVALHPDGSADASPFIDFREQVESRPNEAGLLGIALHPDFDLNGNVFLSYTALVGNSLESRVSRLVSADGGATLDPATEEVLISVEQPFANHNGGHIAFGPDEFLYIGWGDGGDAGDPLGNGQDRSVLLGKLLRIDIDRGDPYEIPSDNPFTGSATTRPEIFALGLRNPWRFSFDRETGALWLADVGQNKAEEINIITSGGNYGWNHREGAGCFLDFSCDGGFIDPVSEYGRGEGISITGGCVYRGSRNPSLIGAYIVGDFGSGRLWAVETDDSGEVSRRIVGATGTSPSAFAEGPDGEVFLIDHTSGKISWIAEGPIVDCN